MPGGWAADYLTKVAGFDGLGVGDERLHQFLGAAGEDLGFCAGGFAAAKEVPWQGVKCDSSWKLFDAHAEGPLAWNPPDAEGLRATHGTASINLKAKQLRGRGLPERIRPQSAEKEGHGHMKFHLAEIEVMSIPDHFADCAISNCVLRLCTDKRATLGEIFRIPKPGGPLAVSGLALKKALPEQVAKEVAA